MGSVCMRGEMALLVVALSTVTADAEERSMPSRAISPQAIQQALAATPFVFSAARQQTSAPHTVRRVVWTSAGAVGGFFAGALIGSEIDRRINDCHCDDPGIKGFFIGMPIGAVAGGVAGWLLSK